MVEDKIKVVVLSQRINELSYNTYIEQTENSITVVNNYKESTKEESDEVVNEKVEISINLARSKSDKEKYLTTCDITIIDEKKDNALVMRKLYLRALYEIQVPGWTKSNMDDDIEESVRVLLKNESIKQLSILIERLTENDKGFPPIKINVSELV